MPPSPPRPSTAWPRSPNSRRRRISAIFSKVALPTVFQLMPLTFSIRPSATRCRAAQCATCSSSYSSVSCSWSSLVGSLRLGWWPSTLTPRSGPKPPLGTSGRHRGDPRTAPGGARRLSARVWNLACIWHVASSTLGNSALARAFGSGRYWVRNNVTWPCDKRLWSQRARTCNRRAIVKRSACEPTYDRARDSLGGDRAQGLTPPAPVGQPTSTGTTAAQKSSFRPVDPFTKPRSSMNSSSDGSVGVPPWSTRNSNRTWPGFLARSLPSGPYTVSDPVFKTRIVSVPSPLSVTRRSLSTTLPTSVTVLSLATFVKTLVKLKFAWAQEHELSE